MIVSLYFLKLSQRSRVTQFPLYIILLSSTLTPLFTRCCWCVLWSWRWYIPSSFYKNLRLLKVWVRSRHSLLHWPDEEASAVLSLDLFLGSMAATKQGSWLQTLFGSCSWEESSTWLRLLYTRTHLRVLTSWKSLYNSQIASLFSHLLSQWLLG